MNKLKLLIAAVALVAGTTARAADEYPSREIRVIVPLATGGGTDTITRQMVDRMAKRLGKPIIVENKGGAGTTIGMLAVAQSQPDGYTLVTNGDTVAIFEYIFANLKFDVHKDFVPVAFFASAPIVLAAHPSLPANNVKELVELAKRNPGELQYATPGVGTPHDLAGLLLQQKAGIKFNEITYKGNGPALTDLLAGHVKLGMFTLTNVQSHIQSGKLKAIAVMGDKRSKLAPELPTMAEGGLAGVNVSSRYVMLAPAGTPQAVLAKLNATATEVVKAPDTEEAFLKLGYETMSVSLKDATAMLKAERDRWAPVLKAGNVKPQ